MKKLILCLLLSPFGLFAADHIFAEMDEQTSKSTGVYKLSLQEKAELSKWLQGTTEKTRDEIKEEVREEIAEQVIKKDKKTFMGFNREESAREEIHSSIVVVNKNRNGKSSFTLANGQIWSQSVSNTLFIPKNKPNPNIIIKPKSMGSWTLYIDGLNRGVKVKRIK